MYLHTNPQSTQDNDPHYLARRGKRVDRRRHDNDATTKADKRGRRRRAVTTRRKIRGVAAGVCRISRGRRERTARPADTGIDYEERPHPLPPFAAALRGWPATATHAASREKSCAVVVPESLRLCPGSKDQFQAFLDEDFQFYQLMTLLRDCSDDTSSWNFLILLSVNGIMVKYCLLNYLLIYSLEKLEGCIKNIKEYWYRYSKFYKMEDTPYPVFRLKEREVTTLWNRGYTDPIRALLYPLHRWKYHICAASLWSNPQNAENGGKFPSSFKDLQSIISTFQKIEI